MSLSPDPAADDVAPPQDPSPQPAAGGVGNGDRQVPAYLHPYLMSGTTPSPDRQRIEATKRRTRRIMIAVVACLVVLAAVPVTLIVILANQPPGINEAQVDQCVSDPSDGSGRVVGCESPRAVYRVVSLAEHTGECASVAGAETIYYDKGFVLCLAPVDVDLAEEINTITAGECVALTEDPTATPSTDGTTGTKAIRSACVTGAYPVIAVARRTTPTLMSGSDVPGIEVCGPKKALVTQVYSWRLEKIIPPDGDVLGIESHGVNSFDVSLCLGTQIP